MSSSPSTGPRSASGTQTRCQSCGSRLRPEETWCSLCHTPVATAKDESQWAPLIPPEEPVRAPVPRDGNPLEAASAAAAAYIAARGAHTPRREADADVAATAARLLSELAASEADRSRETRFAQLQDRIGVSGKGGAVLIAAGGGVLFLVVGLVGLTVLGWLL
jgi:hypothetical protein